MGSFRAIVSIVEAEYKIGVLPTVDFSGDEKSLAVCVKIIEGFLGG